MKTIQNLIEEYINHLCSLHYSPSTINDTRLALFHFLHWLQESYQLHDILSLQGRHLKSWHGHISTKRTQKGLPMKVTTINFYIKKVRGLLSYLIRYSYMRPRLLDEVPYLKEPKTLPRSILSHRQVRRLLSRMATDNITGHRDRTMLEILYSTAIRANELLSLDIPAIDLKRRTALVQGKGDKERLVPIGLTAARYLETYLVAVRPYLLRNSQEQALFINSRGNRVKYGIFRTMLSGAAKNVGFDNVTPHTFRRSCATELIRNGANMYHVKELLGHESLNTLQRYAKLTINDLKKTHKKCHPRERDENR